MKKLKLAAALEKYQKTVKKQKGSAHSRQSQPLPKQKGTSASASKPTAAATVAESTYSEDHVPWHVWTDTSGHRMQRTRLPFHPSYCSRIILCGEGDFSYCRALVEAFERTDGHAEWKIIGTTLDSHETVLKKYHDKARQNLDFLQARPERVHLLFEVDATKLDAVKAIRKILSEHREADSSVLPLTRIIFNFPHTGAGIKDRSHNILAQQRLLLGFFKSCVGLVEGLGMASRLSGKRCTYSTTMVRCSTSKQFGDVGEVRTKSNKRAMDDDNDDNDNPAALPSSSANFDIDNAGETFEVHVTLKTGDPYDSWNIKQLASSTGRLVCTQSFRFVPETYPGYQHCRTIGDRSDTQGTEDDLVKGDSWKEFLSGKPSKTHVFSWATDSKRKTTKKHK